MLNHFADLLPYPPLKRLLREHGGKLLLNCAASADNFLGRDSGSAPEHLVALREEAGQLIAAAAYELTPMQRIAVAYVDAPNIAAAYLARALPRLLVDVLRALLGKPLPCVSLYHEVFPLVHDYGRTCECVGAAPDWMDFFTQALKHPVK